MKIWTSTRRLSSSPATQAHIRCRDHRVNLVHLVQRVHCVQRVHLVYVVRGVSCTPCTLCTAGASEAEAIATLYDVVAPACEAVGIHLSYDGNITSPQCRFFTDAVTTYNDLKQQRKLVNVRSVQLVFAVLPDVVKPVSRCHLDSYGLKHEVEKGREYITNGDTIAAMLLLRYTARFGKPGGLRSMNCEFKARYKRFVRSRSSGPSRWCIVLLPRARSYARVQQKASMSCSDCSKQRSDTSGNSPVFKGVQP